MSFQGHGQRIEFQSRLQSTDEEGWYIKSPSKHYESMRLGVDFVSGDEYWIVKGTRFDHHCALTHLEKEERKFSNPNRTRHKYKTVDYISRSNFIKSTTNPLGLFNYYGPRESLEIEEKANKRLFNREMETVLLYKNLSDEVGKSYEKTKERVFCVLIRCIKNCMRCKEECNCSEEVDEELSSDPSFPDSILLYSDDIWDNNREQDFTKAKVVSKGQASEAECESFFPCGLYYEKDATDDLGYVCYNFSSDEMDVQGDKLQVTTVTMRSPDGRKLKLQFPENSRKFPVAFGGETGSEITFYIDGAETYRSSKGAKEKAAKFLEYRIEKLRCLDFPFQIN